MKVVVQVVKSSSVWCKEQLISSIGKGLLLFVGIGKKDTEKDAILLSEKIANLRIFEDKDGKINLSVQDVDGEILLISQFTLYGDVRKGRRPSFSEAMPAGEAKTLFEFLEKSLIRAGIKVKTGVFQEHMEISLINNGPITLFIDSKDLFQQRMDKEMIIKDGKSKKEIGS